MNNIYFTTLIRRVANNESAEVCGIIKPGWRVRLNRSMAVNVHKLLTIRYLQPGPMCRPTINMKRIRIHNISFL